MAIVKKEPEPDAKLHEFGKLICGDDPALKYRVNGDLMLVDRADSNEHGGVLYSAVYGDEFYIHLHDHSLLPKLEALFPTDKTRITLKRKA